MTPPLKIALAGNPNSGKTSIFNLLTGLNQKVGNFPGVTVERVSGTIKHAGQELEITDFPGVYSLNPKSEDEKVSVEAFTDKNSPFHPDIVVFVADYSQLSRNLLLFSQLADLKIPILLVINKSDLGETAQTNELQKDAQKTLGVETLLVSAKKNIGIQALIQAIPGAKACTKTFWQVPPRLHPTLLLANTGKSLENLYLAYIQLVNHSSFTEREQIQLDELEQRQATIKKISSHLAGTIHTIKNHEKTRAIDKVLTHKIAGPLIFITVLYIVFQCIFKLAQYPMDAIEWAFGSLSSLLSSALPQGFFNDLLARGVLPGLAGVVVFLPQIIFLFFFLSIMEETGYMARIAFLSDRIMSKVGLNGKSVVPLLSGAACAIPAIMAARTIENKKDRLVTIMVTPLISCSARLPVYILLISLIVPEGDGGFLFSYRGLALMGMYLVGVVAAFFVAWVFTKLLKDEKPSFFVMEMPDYQLPRWKNVGQVIYAKAKSFVVQAGKVIVPVSIVLWLLASFAPGNRFDEIDKKYASVEIVNEQKAHEVENQKMAEKLYASYAGELGRFIEPAIRPLGYDWKTGIAIICSFAAREVFVGTMSTLYSLGGDDKDLDSLQQKMADVRHPDTGKPVFTIAVAFSLMMFYAFALQCASTVAVVYKETNSFKWPLIQFLYLGGMAYLAGFLTYTILK